MEKLVKYKTSFRLTAELLALLTRLARHFGTSRASMLEIAVREKAKRDGVTGEEKA